MGMWEICIIVLTNVFALIITLMIIAKGYDAAQLVLFDCCINATSPHVAERIWDWVARTITYDVTEQRPVTFDNIYIGKHRIIEDHLYINTTPEV